MSGLIVSRRGLVASAAAGLGGLLSGCDQASRSPQVLKILRSAEGLSYRSQRLLQSGQPLAREFSHADLSPVFKVNGTEHPGGDAYKALLDTGFADWRLAVNGLVARPLSLSLAQLRAMPGRTQITRHDCVEGWSCIGEWSGPQLAPILAAAAPKPNARYAMFYCADPMTAEGDPTHRYYESLELGEAVHPQTILAHRLNGQTLDIPHGAPVRLRAERLLGYKQPKYLQRIVLVDSLDGIGGGKGGYWEDLGYTWYGGI